MANANLALVTTNNTFFQWMVVTNNEANTINELRNGNFYKDSGSFTVANGTIIVLATAGTGLQVGGNTILGSLTTMNTSLTTAQATFTDNVILTGTGSRLNVANAVVSNVINVSSTVNIGGNVIFNSTGNVINIANNVLITNSGIVQIKNNTNFSNAASSVNVAGILNANTLIVATLDAFNIQFDPAASYGQVNGNLVINNLTVTGNQTVEGSQIISTNRLQIRTNSSTDGDGFFEVFRGNPLNVNAAISFNHSANVLQFAANDAQTFVTIQTTANLNTTQTYTAPQNFASINVAGNANVTQGLSVSGYVTNPVLKAPREVYSNNGVITSGNVDCGVATLFDFIVVGNAGTLSFINCAPSGNTTTIQIMLRQSANGGNTVSWGNTVKWSDGVVPVLSTGANVGDVLQFSTYNGGIFWLGAQVYANIPSMNVF